MEIDYDYLRTGTAIGFRASRELCSNYLFAKITQICDFFAFSNFRKVGNFAASIKRPETKSASASGGLRPLTP